MTPKRCQDKFSGRGIDLQCRKEDGHQDMHADGHTSWPGPQFQKRPYKAKHLDYDSAIKDHPRIASRSEIEVDSRTAQKPEWEAPPHKQVESEQSGGAGH